MVRALRPERSASASWVNPAASRYSRRSHPNVAESCGTDTVLPPTAARCSWSIDGEGIPRAGDSMLNGGAGTARPPVPPTGSRTRFRSGRTWLVQGVGDGLLQGQHFALGPGRRVRLLAERGSRQRLGILLQPTLLRTIREAGCSTQPVRRAEQA